MTNTSSKTGLAFLASVLGHIIWGFSFMFSAIAFRSAAPMVMLTWRHLLALLVMNLLLLTGRFKLSFKGKRLLPLVIMGLLEPVLYFLFESYGIIYTNTVFSGVMIALVPIVVLALSSVFLKEKPTAGQVLFSLLSIAGVVVLAMQGANGGAVRFIGVLLLLGAVLSTACFNLLSRKLSGQFSAFERTYMMMLVGTLVFTASALVGNLGSLSALIAPLKTPGFVWSVLYLGPISSVVAFMLTNYANARIPLTRLSVLANLVTAVSVLAGVVFLKEPFTWLSALCCAVILVGIWGVQKYEKR